MSILHRYRGSDYSSKVKLCLTYNKTRLDTWEIFHPLQKENDIQELAEEVIKTSIGSQVEENLNEFIPPLCTLMKKLLRHLNSKKASLISASMLKDSKLNDFPVDKMNLVRFIRNWGRRFIPTEVFGDDKNRNNFLKNFKVVIGRGKMCRVHLDAILHNLSVERVKWFPNQTTEKAKCQIFVKLVKWLTEKIFWKMILSYFFVSETSWGKNELFYFRKKHFQSTLDSVMTSMKNDKTLMPLSNKDLQLVQASGHTSKPLQMRLMPKRNGCRLIGKSSLDEKNKVFLSLQLLLHLKKRYKESIDPRATKLYDLWSRFRKNVGSKKVS